MKKTAFALGLALTIAACNDTEELDAPTEAEVPEVSEAEAGDEPTGPNEAQLEADAQAMLQADGEMVPADFRGVWDNVDGDCKEGNELRLEIEGGKFTFYESTGEVTDVVRNEDGSIVVSLDMEGEGETWKMERKLEMDSTARRMVITDPAEKGEQPYSARKRCEA